MAKLRILYLFQSSLVLSLIALTGCGATNNMMMNQNRMLMSMTVAPAAANGMNFAMGQVQFTAMGTFSRPPSPAQVTFMAPFSGSWQVSDMNIATINQNGMAQCMHTGTVTVTAMASTNSTSMPGAMSMMVSATATLTCP